VTIIKSLNLIDKKLYFINTEKYDFEKKFPKLKLCYNFTGILTKKKYLTLNPQFYFSNKNKLNLSLLVCNLNSENSHLISLIRYVCINKLEKIYFKKKYYKNFLYNFYPLRQIKSKFYILRFIKRLGVDILKYKLIGKLYYIKIILRQNIFLGFKIGSSEYNCYIQKNKVFLKDFNFVLNRLSNLESKKIYKEVIFSPPFRIWENNFNLWFQEEHYQHYLNFKNAEIINLGVADGFEIPFFLASNIKKIINVDPAGKEKLNKYVKIFVNNFKNKIFFDRSCLYDSTNVRNSNLKFFNRTNLIDLIKKYSLKKNIIIKADIEGSEIKILNEIEEIINKYRPQLAISIYHIDKNIFPVISHLTLIPKKIIKTCENYSFFIQHYSHNRRETVFYCIPNEKINMKKFIN
jgi:hypothetical protein